MHTQLRSNLPRLRTLSLALLCLAPAWAQAAAAGRFQFVAGDVRVVAPDGKERAAQKGQEVNEGETVLTAAGGSAQLKMIDGGILALRPGTQIKVLAYAFNGAEDGTENAALSLLKGGLRAITGLIGTTHKDKVKFQTPTAVIGIRGTDHEPVVIPAPEPGAATDNPPGTYDKVNVGATSLTTEAGTTVIGPNQVGFAGSPTQLPVVLPKLPNFYRATPEPLAKQEPKAEQKQADAPAPAEKAEAAAAALKAVAAVAEPLKAADLPVAVSNLSGKDAQGNELNLTRQTLTASNGDPLNLNGDTPIKPKEPGGAGLLLSYPAQTTGGIGVYPAYFFLGGGQLALTRDAAGNVIGAVDSVGVAEAALGGNAFRNSVTQSGSTLTDLGGSVADGLTWGRWSGGQVTVSTQYFGQDAHGAWGMGAVNAAGEFVIGATDNLSTSLGKGSLHWLAGSVASGNLARILTGSAEYKLIGGTQPTDQLGNVGTLKSASLGVNFTDQTAKASVNLSIAGNDWSMQSGTMRMDGPFFSSIIACTPQCASSAGVTKNGVATSSVPQPNSSFTFGTMNGILLGDGLNRAGLQYSIQETIPGKANDPASGLPGNTFTMNLIQGVAGFAGPTQSLDTPFSVVGLSDGWQYLRDDLPQFRGLPAAQVSGYRGTIDSFEQPAGRVVSSAAGLTEFLGRAYDYTPVNAAQPAPGINEPGTDNTIKIGSAVNRDVGSVTIGGATISWGRWAGGSIDIYSRDGAVKLGSIDNSNRSLHWLAASDLKGSTFGLPMTGTASYTVVGQTSPTDFKGNAGTLGTVTLKADFTNAKVDAGINVSFNSPSNTSNWNMSANNIPLGGDGHFGSSTALNGANGIVHTASCTGASCGPQTIGYIDGHFVGGAQGAAMMYGMATGSSGAAAGGASPTFSPLNGVAGIVVMKR